MMPSWLVPLGRRDHLMVSVDLVQQEQAADSLDESDLHDLRGRGAPFACACLSEGAASVEGRAVEL